MRISHRNFGTSSARSALIPTCYWTRVEIGRSVFLEASEHFGYIFSGRLPTKMCNSLSVGSLGSQNLSFKWWSFFRPWFESLDPDFRRVVRGFFFCLLRI